MKKDMLTIEDKKMIACRLKEAQKMCGLSGIEIAQKADMSCAQISRMFNGKNTNMTISTVNNLSIVMGVNPAWLAFGEGEMKAKANA